MVSERFYTLLVDKSFFSLYTIVPFEFFYYKVLCTISNSKFDFLRSFAHLKKTQFCHTIRLKPSEKTKQLFNLINFKLKCSRLKISLLRVPASSFQIKLSSEPRVNTYITLLLIYQIFSTTVSFQMEHSESDTGLLG